MYGSDTGRQRRTLRSAAMSLYAYLCYVIDLHSPLGASIDSDAANKRRRRELMRFWLRTIVTVPLVVWLGAGAWRTVGAIMASAPAPLAADIDNDGTVHYDPQRMRLKRFATRLDAHGDTIMEPCIEVEATLSSGGMTAASRRVASRVSVPDTLAALDELARRESRLYYWTPKMFSDTSVNVCVALYEMRNGTRLELINPRPAPTAPRHNAGRRARVIVDSMIFDDARDQERWQPYAITVDYMRPADGSYVYDSFTIEGVEVHDFMEGYKLMAAVAPTFEIAA